MPIVAWAKNRKNYVTHVENVAWVVKDSSKFGKSFRGNVEESDGHLFYTDWQCLSHLRPRVMEIMQTPNPFRELIENLRKDEVMAKNFFSQLTYFAVVESSNVLLEDMVFVLKNAANLSVFEFADVVEQADFESILEAMPKQSIKAINFQCPMQVAQIHQWATDKALRFSLRMVRFCGSPGVDYSEFMKIRDEMPCVELLSLQDFFFRTIDDENQEHIDPVKFFRKIRYVFSNLKMLYLDWNIVDTVCMFEDHERAVCQEVQNLFKNLKMQFVAILIYCPDDEMKQSVEKIKEFFDNANKDQLVVHKYDFSVTGGEFTNFSFLVFGEFHYQARTKRLIEVIVDGRRTKPDLRHFSYVLDVDNFLHPDVSIEFGGFDGTDVVARFRQAAEVDPACFADDDAINRVFHNTNG